MIQYIVYSNISIVIILLVGKWVFYLREGHCTSKRRLDGKTVIITGASAGIGKATAFDLASRGAKLILGCRNISKAEGVALDIQRTTGNKDVIVHKLDTSDLSSVRSFAETILQTENNLHVLINNAGIVAPTTQTKSCDGFELTMATNYYGHFLLTNLLLDLLKKSEPSRIINISSIAHSFVRTIDPENLNFAKTSYHYFKAYSLSKLANLLFTVELAARLKGSGVTANSLHPGFVKTELLTKGGGILLTIVDYVASIVAKNSKSGAQTTIHLAVSDDVKNISGKYFDECKESSTSKLGENLGTSRKLWEASELDVKLNT